MLETLFFYLFAWWFVELKTPKSLKIRIILSSLFLIVYLTAAIVLFIIEGIKDDGLPWVGVFPLLFALLYFIRMVTDSKRYESEDIANQVEYDQKITNHKHNVKSYNSLIKKCGMKFFIKYYKQIKRLPLRDVEVTENYSPTEREERLQAAKQIIDLNLTEFTLNEILKSYGDILDETELAQAKSILTELQQSSN